MTKIYDSMEEMKSEKPKRPFLVKIADRLVKDQQELDELAIQLALGKAEAKDKFEDAKKAMRKRVRKLTHAVSSEFEESKEWVQSLQVKLATLRGHLGKGGAETQEGFDQQKENILHGLDEVEQEIQKSPESSKLSSTFHLGSEKIKLQMDLLGKKMQEGKKELTEEFHETMEEARAKMHTLANKLKEKKDDLDERLDDFGDEMRESYEQMKKAIKSW